MDLAGIALRVVFTYVTLLVLVRVSGRLAVKDATTFDFVVALVAGDLIDNAVWAEVPPLQFAAAASSLFATHWAARYLRYRGGRGATLSGSPDRGATLPPSRNAAGGPP